MAKIMYNIKVDATYSQATVVTTPLKAKFNPGDEVRFKSNKKDTVIVYRGSSPFKKGIVVGRPVSIPAGPFVLKANRPDIHFDCGMLKPTGKIGSPGFVAWAGGGGNTPHNP